MGAPFACPGHPYLKPIIMKITKLTREQISKNNYEVKLDEIIEIDGKNYKAVEDCTACPFRKDEKLCGHLICTSCSREDQKSVHFVEVKI